jgi:predicted amino acid dehydrogenase
VALKRDDVLVIEGGVVDVPGDVDFHFEFGFPPKTAYACMAETMMLALEGMTDDYSIGRDIAPDQVDEITGLAMKHGFKLAGFRSFERNVDPAFIQKTRERAEQARAKAGIRV